MPDAVKDIALWIPRSRGSHGQGDGALVGNLIRPVRICLCFFPGNILRGIAQQLQLDQLVFNGKGIGRHRGAELLQSVLFKAQPHLVGALQHVFFDRPFVQAVLPPYPALLIGKGHAAQFGNVRGNLGLAFIPGHFHTKKGPALFRGPGQRMRYLFPHRCGPQIGLTHHQHTRRAEQALQRKLLPEARRGFLVAPVDVPFPLPAGGRKGRKQLLHARAQQLPVRAYKKTESGMYRAHDIP